jgi:hypothetical protein
MKFDTYQCDFITQCFYLWERLSGNSMMSMADISHSALLERLFLGLPVYKEKPPRSHSYPWYDLLDNGYSDRCDINLNVADAWKELLGCDGVVINQSLWKMISANTDKTEFEAEWGSTKIGKPVYPWRVRGKFIPEFHIPERMCWRVELLTPAEVYKTDS